MWRDSISDCRRKRKSKCAKKRPRKCTPKCSANNKCGSVHKEESNATSSLSRTHTHTHTHAHTPLSGAPICTLNILCGLFCKSFLFWWVFLKWELRICRVYKLLPLHSKTSKQNLDWERCKREKMKPSGRIFKTNWVSPNRLYETDREILRTRANHTFSVRKLVLIT